MDNLPELLLEKILGNLDLRDRLKLRAVSRGWRDCIDNMKTRTLFYSEFKRGHINGKNWLVSGKFDRNFIGSTQFEPFEPFLNNFAKSFLSNLRHLRIFSFTMKDSSSLSQALNSLSELEELDLLKLTFETIAYFQLNLPSLKSIQLDELSGLGQLTLDGPKLQRIHIGRFAARFNGHPLEIVHVETVEEAVIYDAHILDVKKLKNLKCLYLYCRCCLGIGSRFLQNLPQLEEIHLHRDNFSIEIFTQKQAQRRDQLKIYHCGFLLNDLAEMNQFPNCDPHSHSKEKFDRYLQNYSRLADQIRDFWFLWYSKIEATVLTAPIDFWKKFVDLHEIKVDAPIENTQQFLQFLKSLGGRLTSLKFFSSQPPALFERLPDYCSVQILSIAHNDNDSLDLGFLLRLEDLISFSFCDQIEADFLRKVFNALKFILKFSFMNRSGTFVTISKQMKQFAVCVDESESVFNDFEELIDSLNFREASRLVS